MTNPSSLAAAEQVTPELAQEAGLRAAIEQIRLLAAQSGLLALNAAFEAAGAPAGAPTDALAADAVRATAEAARAEAAVEALLQQIRYGAALARH